MSGCRTLMWSAVLSVAFGCEREPHVSLEIDDATGRLSEGATLRVQRDGRSAVESERLEHFPARLTLTANESGEANLLLEALIDGEVAARARARVAFTSSLRSPVQVSLRQPCVDDASCDDDVFCNGAELCVAGVCSADEPPCPPSAFECAVVSCLEELAECGVAVDHSLCAFADTETPLFCDTSAGCVPGIACDQTSDCDNGLLCDGAERCLSGQCIAGQPPVVDDQNVCTVDTCVEPTGAVSVPDPSRDGVSCDASGSICKAGVCGSSVCGDGLVDSTSGEQCEDGNSNPNDGCSDCRWTIWTTETLSGLGSSGGDPLQLPIEPSSIAADRSGNLFVANKLTDVVSRLDVRSGIIAPFAGNGREGFSGDNGPATAAQLNNPRDLAIDSQGNLFVADTNNHRIRRIDSATGIISTVAGTGRAGFSGDGGFATDAELNSPSGIAVGIAGVLLIADRLNQRVRWVDPSGVISTIAGTGTRGRGLDNVPALASELAAPKDVLFDSEGDVLIADTDNHLIRRVDMSTGLVHNVAGNGVAGPPLSSGEPLEVPIAAPTSLSMFEGALYVASGPARPAVFRIDFETPRARVFAGNGVSGPTEAGASASETSLVEPTGVALDGTGTVFVSDDSQRRVYFVDDERIDVRIGNGFRLDLGDRSAPAGVAISGGPTGLALDRDNRLLFSDSSARVVRAIDFVENSVERVVGTGELSALQDGMPALETNISPPEGIWISSEGTVYFAERRGTIRRVDPGTGTVATVAGRSTGCPAADLGDDGPARDAAFCDIAGIAGFSDAIFVVDTGHDRIRRVDLTSGTVETVIGGGDQIGGDGDRGVDILLDSPQVIEVDQVGSLYVADRRNFRILRWDPTTETVYRIAGTGSRGHSGLGGPARDAEISFVSGLGVAPNGDLYIGDDTFLKRVHTGSGNLELIAGTGTPGAGGNGRDASFAELGRLGSIVVDESRVYFADLSSQTIHTIDLETDRFFTVAGWDSRAGDGVLENGGLFAPTSIALDPVSSTQDFWIADAASGRIRQRSSDELITIAGAASGIPDEGAEAPYSRLLKRPTGVAYDSESLSLFVSETEGHTVRRIPLSGSPATISTFIGQFGSPGYQESTAAADMALLRSPSGLAIDAQQLWVADTGNHVIRTFDLSTGVSEVFAGSPQSPGFFGDGGPARQASFDNPSALVLTEDSVYISDTGNNRVRRVDRVSGVIETVVGDGSRSSAGVGRPARNFPVSAPGGLDVDSFGNLFVSSGTTIRVVTSGTDGVASGDDQVLTVYGAAPRDTFPETATRCLSDIKGLPGDRDFLVADSCANLLFVLHRE
ncbi:MAG: DUF4215 domain-containing protein [Myxococcota bacterium]